MDHSREDELLYASLLCGMRPFQHPAHRVQLFFVANRELQSKGHHMTYQGILETGVGKGLWENYIKKGTGEYLITWAGYEEATDRFGPVISRYRPAAAYEFECRLVGVILGVKVELRSWGKRSEVFLEGDEYSLTGACEELEAWIGLSLIRRGVGSFANLYDMAIDHGFEMYLYLN